jgi:hypothetical protein
MEVCLLGSLAGELCRDLVRGSDYAMKALPGQEQTANTLIDRALHPSHNPASRALLGPVVQVALDPAALGVGRVDHPGTAPTSGSSSLTCGWRPRSPIHTASTTRMGRPRLYLHRPSPAVGPDIATAAPAQLTADRRNRGTRACAGQAGLPWPAGLACGPGHHRASTIAHTRTPHTSAHAPIQLPRKTIQSPAFGAQRTALPGRVQRPDPTGLRAGPAPVRQLVPRPPPALIRCPPRGHRVLRPRPGSPRPRPRHHHPPPVHHRRVLPVRRRGRAAGSLPGRPCPPAAARLRVARAARSSLSRSCRAPPPASANRRSGAEPPSPRFDGSRHADGGDLDANSTVGRANGRLLMPISGHFVLPVR